MRLNVELPVYYVQGDRLILLCFQFSNADFYCPAIGAGVGAESESAVKRVSLEGIDGFPDCGGRLSCHSVRIERGKRQQYGAQRFH